MEVQYSTQVVDRDADDKSEAIDVALERLDRYDDNSFDIAELKEVTIERFYHGGGYTVEVVTAN